MKRIHIVGCGPRTGTTLLTEMMISSYDIDVYTGQDDRLGIPPIRSGNVFLTKSPKDIVVVEPVLKVMKNLYVILMLRDPRDSIASMHGTFKEQYYSNLLYWKNFMPFAETLADHPRFLTLHYEDLARNPDAVQAKISSFLPFLKEKHAFSQYHHMANPSMDSRLALGEVRPVTDERIGNWRNHKARVLGQIMSHGSISADLIRHGYEPDNAWEEELKGVTPDMDEGRGPKFYEKSFIRKKQRAKYLRALRVWFYHTPFFLWLLDKWVDKRK